MPPLPPLATDRPRVMYGPRFFYHVLKPGRYLGGEEGIALPPPTGDHPLVVWFYPGRYEEAMADPGWRRGYFQLAGCPNLRCVRAVEYAADAWDKLARQGLPPFALDGHGSLRDADLILFWVPDLFAAAHIPSMVRKLGLNDETRPRLGVVVDGFWAPRFLRGHGG